MFILVLALVTPLLLLVVAWCCRRRIALSVAAFGLVASLLCIAEGKRPPPPSEGSGETAGIGAAGEIIGGIIVTGYGTVLVVAFGVILGLRVLAGRLPEPEPVVVTRNDLPRASTLPTGRL